MNEMEDFDFDAEGEERFEEEQTDEQKKLRYKLYAPYKMFDKTYKGYGEFHKDDFRGFYASQRFAEKAGAFRHWYQVVDKYSNKVISEFRNEELDY